MRKRNTRERKMPRSRIFVHLSSPLIAALIAGGTLGALPLIAAPAAAQVSIRADFRAALQPYGRWERIARWGDVWVPDNLARGWRPYTVGRWVYTDDWGWYWASDEAEDAWGWVVYHYGHWLFDADLGWVWVPGDEWGPGWVQWRRDTQYLGWAPLPPDESIEVVYRDEPDVWVFVRARDFVAPRIATVILPEREYAGFLHDTVVVNRTVELRDRHFAVNPGIAPAIVAAAVGRPIRSFDVHPRVLAGTAQIAGATQVRADELGRGRANFREQLRETQQEIRPTSQISQPEPLGRNERGRLGENPPRAATTAPTQGTQGRGNAQPQQPQTQGLGQREQRQPSLPGNRPQEQRQIQGQQPSREPPRTQGLGQGEQRQPNLPGNRPQEQRQLQPQPQREAPRTQGLGQREQRQPNLPGNRPQEQRQLQPQPQPPREAPRAEGPGGARPPAGPGGPPQGAQRQLQPQPQREAPRTEGLGGARGPGGPGGPPQGAQRQLQPQPQPPREAPRTEGLGGARGPAGPGGPPQGARGPGGPGAPPQGAQRPGGPGPGTEGRGGLREQR
jgi:hypothetical protein